MPLLILIEKFLLKLLEKSTDEDEPQTKEERKTEDQLINSISKQILAENPATNLQFIKMIAKQTIQKYKKNQKLEKEELSE